MINTTYSSSIYDHEPVGKWIWDVGFIENTTFQSTRLLEHFKKIGTKPETLGRQFQIIQLPSMLSVAILFFPRFFSSFILFSYKIKAHHFEVFHPKLFGTFVRDSKNRLHGLACRISTDENQHCLEETMELNEQVF